MRRRQAHCFARSIGVASSSLRQVVDRLAGRSVGRSRCKSIVGHDCRRSIGIADADVDDVNGVKWPLDNHRIAELHRSHAPQIKSDDCLHHNHRHRLHHHHQRRQHQHTVDARRELGKSKTSSLFCEQTSLRERALYILATHRADDATSSRVDGWIDRAMRTRITFKAS